MTKFIAEELSLDQVSLIRPLLARIARVDRSLADQLRRSASSVTLNLAEGSGRVGGHRRERFRAACGSHHEVRSALKLAVRYGYLVAADLGPFERLADELARILHKLAR